MPDTRLEVETRVVGEEVVMMIEEEEEVELVDVVVGVLEVELEVEVEVEVGVNEVVERVEEVVDVVVGVDAIGVGKGFEEADGSVSQHSIGRRNQDKRGTERQDCARSDMHLDDGYTVEKPDRNATHMSWYFERWWTTSSWTWRMEYWSSKRLSRCCQDLGRNCSRRSRGGCRPAFPTALWHVG